jgi:uncharacterized protein (TIGR03067 family)
MDFLPEVEMKLPRALLLAPLALLFVAADPASEKDAKLLQGTWKGVTFERAGEKMPDNMAAAITMTIKGDMLTVSDGNANETGTFTLDATKKPRTMDLVTMGAKILLIYDVDCDTLKLCWRTPGGERPKEFTGKDTDGYLVLMRGK